MPIGTFEWYIFHTGLDKLWYDQIPSIGRAGNSALVVGKGRKGKEISVEFDLTSMRVPTN
jgi:hypothetical protein